MESQTAAPHTGSCLCRAIGFEIHGVLAPIQVCHCLDCRKAQGGPLATNIPVAVADFRIVSGEDHLKVFASSPGKERVFCATCGAPIFSRRADTPGVLRLRAGTLDAPVQARLASHAYTADKAGWWEISDDLPQYPRAHPPG